MARIASGRSGERAAVSGHREDGYGPFVTDPERRARPRTVRDYAARVAGAPEQPLPFGTVVDLSAAGVLVVLPEPSVPLRSDDVVLVSLALPDGALHARGSVRRLVRGLDDRFYLAVAFSDLHPEDAQRLGQALDETALT